MCQRDVVTACQARSHLLALGSEARIPTGYVLGSFGLSKVRYALIGMEVPRPIIKQGATKQKIEQKKRRPIRNRSGAWYWQDVRWLKLTTYLIATKGTTERTGLLVFRREVEDTTGFSSLGTVEPAAERPRELTSGVQVIVLDVCHLGA